MNGASEGSKIKQQFLNGVCRHEPSRHFAQLISFFLNGVCRHERVTRDH